MHTILFEKRKQQAWITLNRPAAKNMINGDMVVELVDAWQEVRLDAAIRVVVLTASGAEDFCCGGDLSEVIPLWTGAKNLQQRLRSDCSPIPCWWTISCLRRSRCTSR